MMKKAIIFVLTVFGMSMIAGAQSKIVNESLAYDGEKVIVSFDIESGENNIPSNRKEVIMPYIYNGNDTVWLQKVEVYGRNRLRREAQEAYLAKDPAWAAKMVVAENSLKGQTIAYRETTPLRRWMQPATLGIRREIVGCACEEPVEDQTVASSQLFQEPPVEPRRIPTDYALIEPTRQWDFGQDELEIIFKVSKIEIDSTVFNNEVTFGKILAAVDKIYANPKFKVDQIEIAGYASPEGSVRFNKWLGENRAKALINYIITNRPQYGLTEANFRMRNGEENWEGLKRLTRASNIPDEDIRRIIEVIDSDLAAEPKKAALKALDGGRIYRRMLEEVYPHLRCARYLAVYYDSTNDEAVDAVNEANRLIREGRYAQAQERVQAYADDFRAFNTIGVALMMQGRFEEAMPWLQKALEHDFRDAQRNIDAIDAELEYEQLKRKEREEYLRRFE